jgi:hypothetical protein
MISGVARLTAHLISLRHCCVESKRGRIHRVRDWEIMANNLKKAGWSLGYVSALDSEGRTLWIVDAHRDGKRFVVRADDKLTAFVELGSAIPRVRQDRTQKSGDTCLDGLTRFP